MPGVEEPPIGEPKPLSPEEKSAVADTALEEMDKFLASKSLADRPSPDMPAVTDPTLDTVPLAVAGVDAHTRATLPDASVGAPASTIDTPPDDKPASNPLDRGAPLGRNRRNEQNHPAKGGSDPVADAVALQKAEELRLATEVQDAEIKSLQTEYEGNGACTPVLEKLTALLGTNPADSVIAGIRSELEALVPEPDDASAPTTLPPIRRDVVVPSADPVAPPTIPDATGAGATPVDIKESPVLNDVLEVGYPKNWELVPKEVKPIVDLADGEEALYRTNDPVLPTVRIKKEGNRYRYIGANGKPAQSDFSERQIQDLARVENWERQVDEMEKKTTHLDGLATMVAETRLAFVTIDYKQRSAWEKLKGIFGGNISAESNSADIQTVREDYNRALSALQEAELADIRESGLTGLALRERMGQMLHYYKYVERVKLAEARDQVKIEHKNFPQHCISAVENLGRWYNKLPLSVKLAVGAAALGSGAAASFGLIGGTTAAVAGGVVLIRRLVTTAGGAVSADALTQMGLEWVRKRGAKKEMESQLEEFDEQNLEGGISPEALAKLRSLVDRDRQALPEKYKKGERQDFYRRGIIGMAAVAGVGASFASYFGSGTGAGRLTLEEAQARSEAALGIRPGVPAGVASAVSGAAVSEGAPSIPAPEQVSSMPPHELARFQEANMAPGDIPPLDVPLSREETYFREVNMTEQQAGAVASPETTARITLLREDYTVNANGVNDGRKGLWGVLERRLEGVPKADHNKVIASLENIMRAKLDGMTPEARALAGFHGTLPDGKVNLDLIRPGDRIDFGKLLTAEEIRSVLDGHSVGAPNVVADVIDRPLGASNGISPIDQTIIDEGGVGEVRESAHGIPVSPMDHALNENTISRLANQPMVTSDPTAVVREAILEDQANTPARNPAEMTRPSVRPMPMAEMMSPQDLANPARLGQFMAEHPELARPYQHTLRGMKTAIFSMPVDMNKIPYIEPIEGGFNVLSQGAANMDRVLETHQGFRTGPMSPYEYDRRPFPFKSTQVERLAHLVRTASHPDMFGSIGRPLPGETVNQYMERMAAMAAATHNEKALAVSFRASYRN